MRIGLFGGSFDPVHQGHLVAAQQALGQACLDELWFLPAASPPHKAGQSRVPFQARLDMLNLALAGHPRMRVNTLESELPTPNFTVNTLRELARRHPEHTWSFLLGGDMLADLPTWREPVALVEMADLVVMPRPEIPVITESDLAARLGCPVRLLVLDGPKLEISSRWIRGQVRSGGSIRYLMPRAPEKYIQEHMLYGAPPEAATDSPSDKQGETLA